MGASAYQNIKTSLRELYLNDNRPWLVGCSSSPVCHAELVEASLTLPRFDTRHSALQTSPASTWSCGNSRFGCCACTVVERDKASEGLLAAGDERMENLIAFRETLSRSRN